MESKSKRFANMFGTEDKSTSKYIPKSKVKPESKVEQPTARFADMFGTDEHTSKSKYIKSKVELELESEHESKVESPTSRLSNETDNKSLLNKIKNKIETIKLKDIGCNNTNFCFENNKKCSVGAILYTIKNNKIYYILGIEPTKEIDYEKYVMNFTKNKIDYNYLFPFKGSVDKDDKTIFDTAKREIHEETLEIIHIDTINFQYCFTTVKKYYLGFIEVNNSFVQDFNKLRKNKKHMDTLDKTYKEKLGVIELDIETIINNDDIPKISRYPILLHYYNNKYD